METGASAPRRLLSVGVSSVVAGFAVAAALVSTPGQLAGRGLDQWIETAPRDAIPVDELAFRVDEPAPIDRDGFEAAMPPRSRWQLERTGSTSGADFLEAAASMEVSTSSTARASTSTSTPPTSASTSSISTSTPTSTPPSSTTSTGGTTGSTSETTVARAPTNSPTTHHPSPHPPSSTASTMDSGHGSDNHHSGSNDGLASLTNTNPLFVRYSSVPSSSLDLNALTEPVSPPDNGSVGDGQFRMACQYSHFAYDDPIVFPGQPGKSHLHMFFGNTLTDAHTTASELLNTGGATCNGFELNRSAYWTPALLDGRGNAVVPEQIILYYKSKLPSRVKPLPVGLKMISGSTGSSFAASEVLFWSCGGSGHAYNKSNHIPDCGGDTINASIVFPECWDGRNLDSADHRSHLLYVNAQQECPSSHPVRLPQISILLYYPGQASVDGWRLSADGHHGSGPPGGSLHADWFGGWNDDALNLWIDGCITRARNCSYGQTGTDRRFAPLNVRQNYPGPYVLPLP